MSTCGTLFLIGTPIGNLGDITLRALESLRGCDLLFCEDTRVAKKLLNHFEIHKPTRAFHRASPPSTVVSVETALRAGKQVAYVANAGMPGLSDPGARLVAMCMEKGLPFNVIPGPSALVTALAAMPEEVREFSFFAFPPGRIGKRRVLLERIARLNHPAVLFVAPHDLRELLSLAVEVLPARKTRILFCRELTKLHQEIRLCSLAELMAELPDRVRGEITLVVVPPGQKAERAELQAATPESISRNLADKGFSKRDVMKILRAVFPGQGPYLKSRLYNRND